MINNHSTYVSYKKRDRKYYEVETRNGNQCTRTVYSPYEFKFSNGYLIKIVASDEKVDELLKLLAFQDENIRSNNISLWKLKLISEDELKNKR